MSNGMQSDAAVRATEQPTPERFFNALNAHQQTEAMKAAVELDVFTSIAEGNTSPAAIAERCKAAERGVRILCDFLTIHGFLTKENGKYGLAPDAAAFLNRHSPAYLAGASEFLLTARIRRGHELLTEAVRQGGTALGRGTLEPENPDWVQFARAMMPLKQSSARDMNYPAEVMATELAVAEENARAAETQGRRPDRHHLIPGDAFVPPVRGIHVRCWILLCHRNPEDSMPRGNVQDLFCYFVLK